MPRIRRYVLALVVVAVFALASSTSQAQSGPVAAYNFNEGAGSTVADSSGNGNGGTASGTSWAAGHNGGSALSFNGTSSLVTVNDANSLDLTTGMTLEAWIYPRALTNWRSILLKERPGQLAYSLYAIGNGGRPNVEIAVGSNVNLKGSSALPLNAWSHLAATYDGANLRLYVNGAQVASRATTGSIVTSANPLRIGGNTIWGEYFNGLVDDVRIYNRALSAAELTTDMNTPVGGTPPDTTPPVRSNGLPTGTLAAGTTTATLQVTTNELATCRYATTAGVAYTSMTGAFSTTNGTTHTAPLTGLTNGTTYSYYVRCRDQAATPNTNTDDYTITFSVASAADTTPPVRSNGLPTGTLAAGTTSATLQLTTNELATCRYATTAGVAYASMTGSFSTTNGLTHTAPLTGLANGTTYNYFVRCRDQAATPNTNPDDYTITFSVASATDATPPVRSNGLPAGTLSAGTTTATLQVTTNELATCRYATTAGVAYASMTNSFSTTNGLTHTAPLTGLTNGTAYTYYVRCQDQAPSPNANSDDYIVAFNVASQAAAGLVAAYGFNEGAGSSVADASGDGNGGTAVGTSWAAGHNGGSALSFNGSTSYVTVNDSNSLDLTTGMTLEAWVYPRTLTSWRNIVMKERTGQLAYTLYANTDSNRPSTEITTSANTEIRGGAAVPLNAWTHLASTYNGATLTLYVNGASVGSVAVTGSLFVSTGALRIGGNSIWGENFDGVVDDVRVYNRPLSAAEIVTDRDSPVGGAPPDTTPPQVTATTPAAGGTNVHVGDPVTATFSEPMTASTITTSTFDLRAPNGALVASSVTYDPVTATAVLTPSATLAAATTYTATVHGGSVEPTVKDLSGLALAANKAWSFTTESASPCSSPANAIVAENCRPGNPQGEWDVSGSGDAGIQGFATDVSVNKGQTVHFKIDTTASSYWIDIYRLGYYSGMGARRVATINPSRVTHQASCLTDSQTGLIDCGNWSESATWTVPSDAASGLYIARPVRASDGGASHIPFVVRDDASHSDLLFQTSDTTWLAYNDYGGNSLYVGQPAGRAYKVSYNRPYTTRAVSQSQNWIFNAEYPMIRWLEANGYDMTYTTGVDTDRSGALILQHKVWVSNGHDEYWSGNQRAQIEAARAAGVHLAFFSGNTMFWKTRWENSIDGTATPYRTLVCYKDTMANAKIDPLTNVTTGSWRDPRFSPPADGGRPENAVTGSLFRINGVYTNTITVRQADGKMRFWRNTAMATLASGATASLAPGTIGAEVDVDEDNGVRPPGVFSVSNTPITVTDLYLTDYGSSYGAGSTVHGVVLYRHASGALVFHAGSYQWAWGLDANHDRTDLGSTTNASMQQATVNLFADMGAQAGTLQSPLTAAAASTDTVPPTSVVTAPNPGTNFTSGSSVTISGTATDSGGGVVAGVEVSVDSGATWHPASGRASWTYTWTPGAGGTFTIRSRAVDDSGNLEVPSNGVVVTVNGGGGCPCNLFGATTPGTVDSGDGTAAELGVKFRSTAAGTITGIRFYKASTNPGPHVVSLWSSTGTRLATATSSGESSSGWQQVSFATPVSINANTTYIASYFAPSGHYSRNQNYFTSAGFTNGSLTALQDGADGGNGVYTYTSSSAFPASTFSSTNYWVDVVFGN